MNPATILCLVGLAVILAIAISGIRALRHDLSPRPEHDRAEDYDLAGGEWTNFLRERREVVR